MNWLKRTREGRKAAFEARLFKLKDHLFLDLYLTKVEGDDLKVNAWDSISLVPAHLLLKVELTESAVNLAAMNPDWTKTFLKEHPDAIAHRIVSDGSIVLWRRARASCKSSCSRTWTTKNSSVARWK